MTTAANTADATESGVTESGVTTATAEIELGISGHTGEGRGKFNRDRLIGFVFDKHFPTTLVFGDQSDFQLARFHALEQTDDGVVDFDLAGSLGARGKRRGG